MITLGPAVSEGLSLSVTSLSFLGSGTDAITVGAVLNVEPPGGLVPPVVAVSGNTITVKATSATALDGKMPLGAIAILPGSAFRGGTVTFTSAILTMGETIETLELNQVVTLTSAQTDVPIVQRPPVPVTVTDSRALIEWGTNKPSTSTVLYGTSATDLSQQATSSTLTVNHRVLLEGLSLGTRYFLQVQSADAQGRTSDAFPSRPFLIVTRSEPDTKPPRIIKGPVTFSITTNSAEIVLNTDEAAKVDVSYGTAADALTQTESRTSTDLAHHILLEGLDSGETYFYKVKVTDLNANNTETPAAKSFITRSSADTKGPVILGRPTVIGRTRDAAVIAWRTNESATGALRYGTDKDTPADSVTADNADLEHRLAITNLLTDTTYYYSVRVSDASGNTTTTPEFIFTTRSTQDSEAPRIVRRPIVPRVSNTDALIRWKTNEPATSIVRYGTTTDIFDDTDDTSGITITSPDFNVKHQVQLTNLTPETTYYFSVSSSDLAGNGPTTSETQLSFTTRSKADTRPPVIFSRPVALGIGKNSAIVAWGADEPHSAVISYRVKAAAKQAGDEVFTDLLEDIVFERKHAVTLSDLAAGETYEYQVETVDGAGNSNLSKVHAFTTRSGDDTKAPSIVRGPGARNITSTSATIDWRTDEPSDSKVSHGTTTAYGETIEDPAPLIKHSITITDLTPNTVYHYAVGSADQSGNVVTTLATGTTLGLSSDHTFRTLSTTQEVAPVFLEGPIVEFTDALAIVKWTTDQLSTSRVAIGVDPTSSDAAEDGAEIFGTASQRIYESNDLDIDHSVTVTGLSAGKAYKFRASSTHASGITANHDDPRSAKFQPPGGFGSFTTSTESDTQFPVITQGPTVVASTASTLTIEWQTDESGNSQVSFGTSSDSLTSAEIEGTNVTAHQMVLTKLAAGATYAYKIGSTDATGNGVTESDVAYGTTPSSIDLTAPVISTAPAVIYQTDRTATISWVTNEAADAEISFGTSQTALDEVRSLPDLDTEHTITLTNLTAGTTYYYKAASTDQSNNGPVSSSILEFTTESSPDNTSPTITNVSVAPGDKTATVAWTTNEVSDSAVNFGPSGGSLDFTTGSATDVTAHSVTLTNLTPGTTYSYLVESIDRSGNGPAQSATATFDTYAEGAVPPPATPAKPTATPGNSTVKVVWSVTDATGITGYVVERAVSAGSFATISTLGSETAYVDATVENGLAYQYRITSLGAQQAKGTASEASAEVTPAADQGPDAPTLSLIQGSQLTPTFVVDNPTDASLSFTFHLSSDADFSDALAVDAGVQQGDGLGPADSGLNATAWTVNRTLTNGSTYYYRIKASDGTFDSPYTTDSFTVDTSKPDYPGDFTGDYSVNFVDFLEILKTYSKASGDDGYNATADLTNDGQVNFLDFLQFLKVFSKQYVQGEGSSKLVSRPALVYGVDADARLQLLSRPVSSQSGDIYEVDATISNVVDLKGFGLRVSYDPGKLLFVSATDGQDNLLEGDGRTAELFSTLTHDPAKGEIFLANAVSVGDPAEGEGLIARMRFRLLTDNPQGDLVRIAEGLLIDGKYNVNLAQNLGDRLSLVPDRFALEQNYPNPFNPETLIRYAVPDKGRVTLKIYNVLGQEVFTLVDQNQVAGYYAVRWNGRDRADRTVASGVYLYRLQAEGFAQVHKMLLLK